MLGSLSIGSKFAGLFKSKKLWITLSILAALAAFMFSFWYMQNKIDSLSGSLATAEQRIQQVQSDNKSLERTITEVEDRLARVREAQARIDKVRDQLDEQLSTIREQLDKMDIKKGLEKNPEKTLKKMRQTFNEQLRCIEAATGNEGSQCDSLKSSPSR